MPLDKNGNYTRWQGADRCKNDRDADIKILASRMDNDLNDTAEALGQMLPADGRKPMTGELKMGGNAVRNVGGGSQSTDAANIGQIQRFVFNYGADTSAEANRLTVDLTPALTQLPQAGWVFVTVKNANTGKTTLKINQLEEKPVYLGDQEIGEGVLQAGQTYPFFYNKTLDAWQVLASGATAGTAVPPFTMIMLDHLLQGGAAVGWELQGTRCYKSKYWEQYQQLTDEHAEAVSRTETVEGKEFAYKVNLKTMRRFYSKADYDARYKLCGDSGGYVLDEETYSFYLPKCNNYLRPAVTADNLEAYQQDTMRKMTGHFNFDYIGDPNSKGRYAGPFYAKNDAPAEGRHIFIGASGSDSWNPADVGYDTSRAGSHFAGSETAPKSRFVAVYYKMGTAYTEQISRAVLAAEKYAAQAAAAVSGTGEQVKQAQEAADKARTQAQASANSAQEAKTYSLGALGLLTNKGVMKFWRGTRAEYQALPDKDPDTLYSVEE